MGLGTKTANVGTAAFGRPVSTTEPQKDGEGQKRGTASAAPFFVSAQENLNIVIPNAVLSREESASS